MSISLLLFGSILFAACLIGLIYLIIRLVNNDADQQDTKWNWTKTDTTIVIIVVSVTFVLTLILGFLMAKKKKNYQSTIRSSSEVRSDVLASESQDNSIFQKPSPKPAEEIRSDFMP
jgi:ABC-type Fe3+-siderophore transport system permease subunit